MTLFPLKRRILTKTFIVISLPTMMHRYDGFVLDIPLADGIEEFIAQIKANGLEGGIDLLLIQVLKVGIQAAAAAADVNVIVVLDKVLRFSQSHIRFPSHSRPRTITRLHEVYGQ